MRESTINRMINESRRIYRTLVWYTVILVASIVTLAHPATVENAFLFGLAIAGIIVSLVAIALNILLVNGLNRNIPPSPPPVTYEDVNGADSMLTFNTSQRVTDGRLEDRSTPNSIGLGRFDLSRNEWRKLAVTLSNANWVWNRRLLQRTTIWEGLTSNNRYNIVTDDFEKMGAVRTTRDDRGKILKARVTPVGREEICKLAATPLL